MRKNIIILIVLVFVLSSCSVYTYNDFYVSRVRGGEAKILKKLPDGNYLVTSGYIRLYLKACKKIYPKQKKEYYEGKALALLCVEFVNGSWIVKPGLVKAVEEWRQKDRRR